MTASHKARIVRAAAIRNVDLTQFVTQSALREADAVIEQEAVLATSARDFERILALLEHPPTANARLRSAIDALPDDL